jgi:3-hydroxybutyryl-CoA dehydratase
MLPLQMLYFEDLSVGMTETLNKVINSSDVVGFAEVTGDRNPIHLSEHFAAKTPFGTRIAHGLYTASLISAVLGTRLPGPGAIYISQTLNFRAPVKIGDTVDVTVAVAELMPEKFRARLTCTCSVNGEVVLDGEAWVKCHRRKWRTSAPNLDQIKCDFASKSREREIKACVRSSRQICDEWWQQGGAITMPIRATRSARKLCERTSSRRFSRLTGSNMGPVDRHAPSFSRNRLFRAVTMSVLQSF